MIFAEHTQFILQTDHTTYCFRRMPSGHLEHLYYGASVEVGDGAALIQRTAMLGGNGIAYSQEYPLLGLEDLSLEFSSLGHGDVREPFLDITCGNGSRTSDFLYEKHWVTKGKAPMKTLPASCEGADPEGIQELHVLLKDSACPVELELIYAVFPHCDVITRRAVVRNRGNGGPITVNRLMSLQLDLDDPEYDFHWFTGAWAREMNHQRARLRQGKIVNESRCGISSSMNNPFVMLSRPKICEEAGECYGFNLVYSGNHYEAAEVNAYGRTRVITGLHPEGFGWQLLPGEELESPEAVMTFSSAGFRGMSRNLHSFVRQHIVRGEWRDRERPVLLNSWEAVYFDFNEEKLLAMAERARDVGIELFVMDDGWFGGRNDSTSSLGDWFVNREKLPGGIGGLAKRIEAMGMKFGLWVEPEMISVKSQLYREHPDWAVEVPGAGHSEGRSQRILDLTRPQVQEWLIETMRRVFGEEGVSYVKWDNNRIFTDLFSRAQERQTEFLHRYYLGYYKVMGELVRRFPHILFEGCASGGNRFDLGVLCYMPQIWASDNTDALCRAEIQTGISYGYPLSVAGSHVSASPNHQTGRHMPWATRFGVAAFGVLGYELDLAKLTEQELAEVREQIAFYKEHRRTLQFGTYLRLVNRGRNDFRQGLRQWMTVAEDGSEAIGFSMTEQVVPNMSRETFRTAGLPEDRTYRFRDWQADRGAGTEEDFAVSGNLLNRAGVRLTQFESGNGGRPGTRKFFDGCSRIFIIQSVSKE